jgi:hypothetical protein
MATPAGRRKVVAATCRVAPKSIQNQFLNLWDIYARKGRGK